MSALISVIIPTHNRASVILRAIQSVLNQTYTNFELIVVDDGSSDETYELLLPLIETHKIIYHFQENGGVSKARNAGARMATGKWLAFLDSDDEWLPHKLQEQTDYLSTNPHLKIVYGEELWIRNGKRVNQKIIHKKSGGWIFEACIQQCLIAPSSVMLLKDFFFELGGFDENFSVCEDYDLWLKISSLVEIGFLSNPQIIKHGGHADQLSTSFVAMDLWRLQSMASILTTRSLDAEQRTMVVESMKRRGHILMQGYQKHGNRPGLLLVKNILSEIEKNQ